MEVFKEIFKKCFSGKNFQRVHLLGSKSAALKHQYSAFFSKISFLVVKMFTAKPIAVKKRETSSILGMKKVDVTVDFWQ